MNPRTSTSTRVVVTTAAAIAALGGLAACGDSTDTTAPTAATSPSSAASTPAGGAAGSSGLHVAHTSLGDVLVDAKGRTVYTLSADKHGRSTCNSSCTAVWPPVAPTTAGSDVTGTVASGTTPGGGAIATIGGAPLYTYSGDSNAGDVNGQGIHSFGGEWYAVSPSGATLDDDASPGSSDDSGDDSGGSGPYGY